MNGMNGLMIERVIHDWLGDSSTFVRRVGGACTYNLTSRECCGREGTLNQFRQLIVVSGDWA